MEIYIPKPPANAMIYRIPGEGKIWDILSFGEAPQVDRPYCMLSSQVGDYHNQQLRSAIKDQLWIEISLAKSNRTIQDFDLNHWAAQYEERGTELMRAVWETLQGGKLT